MGALSPGVMPPPWGKMKIGTINISELVLPAEDGALARAWANLDAKLSAWRSMIASVQGRCSAPPLRETRAAEAEAPAPQVSEAAKSVAVAAESPTPAEVAPRTIVAAGHAIDENEILAGLDPDMASAIRSERRAGNCKKTLGEMIAEYEARQAEDEWLLRTLEPEMASAIRVQRRLCAYRKSVRELIAEYKPEVKPDPKPKSWWDKVKEGTRHAR